MPPFSVLPPFFLILSTLPHLNSHSFHFVSSPQHRRIQELKLGGKVERRRREPSRGTEGTKGVGREEEVSLSPQRERSVEGAVP